MEAEIDFRTCPVCDSERTADLLAPDASVDTTLDLVLDGERAERFAHVDLKAFRSPVFAICERCALIFVRKRSTPEAARAYYAELFHIIETPLPFDSLPIPQRFLDRKGRLARDLVAILAERGILTGVESVLYVRCDAGEGPRVLRDEHGLTEVYALEVLPSLVRHAREVLAIPNVEPFSTSEFENPFPKKRFDLIVCDEAFGHALIPSRVAKGLKSLLSNGGALVLFNEKDHSQILKSARLFPYGMNFFHKQLFTRNSLKFLLEVHGFSIEELPHPVVGKPSSLKNTKILYVARVDSDAAPDLLSDEVDDLARLFREWWSAYKWRRRGRRLRSLFPQRRPALELGGVARR